MRILSWNLNHRAGVRDIPAWLAPALEAERPDVFVCTEYVRGPQHVELLKSLRAIGLRDSDVTAPYHPGANCILVAAGEPLLGGPVQPPHDSDPSVQSGFAHVVLEKSAIHLFAVRIPEPGEMREGKREACEWLGDALDPYLGEPAIVIAEIDATTGDASECDLELGSLMPRGWRLVSARAGADIHAPTGKERHVQLAFLSPLVALLHAEYSWRIRGLSDEASVRRVGIPDQAMLVMDVKRGSAQ